MTGILSANETRRSDGTKLDIHRQPKKSHLMEAIVILPRDMLYSTDISVTLRISAGNQQNGKTVKQRNRKAQQETIYANSAHTKNDVSSLKNPTMYPQHNTDTYNSFRSLILRKTKI